MPNHSIGVDILKSHSDAFRHEDEAAQRFENSAAGFWLCENGWARPQERRSCSRLRSK